MKNTEPKIPESIKFSHFFGSFYVLPADFRQYIKNGVTPVVETFACM